MCALRGLLRSGDALDGAPRPRLPPRSRSEGLISSAGQSEADSIPSAEPERRGRPVAEWLILGYALIFIVAIGLGAFIAVTVIGELWGP